MILGKTYQTPDEKYSENESNVLKPKGKLFCSVNLKVLNLVLFLFIALFEDGDVAGERMFTFNLKQKKTPSRKLSPQRTPKSKKKSTKNYQDNQAVNHPQGYNTIHSVLEYL